MTDFPVTPPPPAALPPAARAALDALAARHPDLARIEAAVGPLPWRTRPRGFAGLLRAITGQQISNQAAGAIWARVAALPGALGPDGFLALSDAALRGAGFSLPKVAHARGLALACVTGQIDLAALPPGDDDAIAALVALPGIGPWTAQVYLLFAEQRPDVFPAGDLAIAAALADLRGLDARPTPRVLATLAAPWAPHRALAARLLWHWWRFRTGRAAGEAE